MSIAHVYAARDSHVPKGYAPLPTDARELQKTTPVRTEPPLVKVPLNGLNDQGHVFESLDAPWPLQRVNSGVVGDLGENRFSKTPIALPAGARLTWRFQDRTPHNVLFANG